MPVCKSQASTGLTGFARILVDDAGGQAVVEARSLSETDLLLAIELLKVASFSVLYLALAQTTTGILQGMGAMRLPVYALLVGGILKVILNIVLVKIPSINIYGAEIATISCYFTVALINTYNIFRYEKTKQHG